MSFIFCRSLLGFCAATLQCFVPAIVQAGEPVSCFLESTRIDEVTVDAVTREHKDVKGQVDVACINPSRHFQVIELALVERPAHPTSASSRAIRLELFLDQAMTNLLPSAEPGAEEFSPFVVEGRSTLRISFPIYGRVSLVRLESAGSYLVGREIGLIYRARSPSGPSAAPSSKAPRGHV